jgi:hypothetical protein
MMLADPGFIEAQPVHVRHQVQIARNRQRGVFAQGVERGDERAEAQTLGRHAFPHKEEKKLFFFEKKNQKTFATWARSCLHLRAQLAKVFCFFSLEKKILPYPTLAITASTTGGSAP